VFEPMALHCIPETPKAQSVPASDNKNVPLFSNAASLRRADIQAFILRGFSNHITEV
jgi:hypothetical protein